MARTFYDLFGKEKAVIGMIHLNGFGGKNIVERALREIRLYEEEGLSGVIVEDYHGDLEDIRATLEAIDWKNTEIKIGVNALRSTAHAFQWASEYGAKFVQVDSVQSADLDLDEYHALRKKYSSLVVLGGVGFKYTKPTGNKLEKDLFEAMPRCEAIVTTGEGTGIETSLKKLQDFRQSLTWLGGFPLISGAGVNINNVQDQLSVTDGIIVGSYFKSGNTRAEVERDNVRGFMKKARAYKS